MTERGTRHRDRWCPPHLRANLSSGNFQKTTPESPTLEICSQNKYKDVSLLILDRRTANVSDARDHHNMEICLLL